MCESGVRKAAVLSNWLGLNSLSLLPQWPLVVAVPWLVHLPPISRKSVML